jgi:hypothetical protein
MMTGTDLIDRVPIKPSHITTLSLGVNLVAVGLVLRLEVEVFVCRSKEHLTVRSLANQPSLPVISVQRT